MTNQISRTTEAMLSGAGCCWQDRKPGGKKMEVKVLAKSEWPTYFSRLHKAVEGKKIKIEVVGAMLGDQILVKSAPLLGATYEPRENTLEISVNGMTHVVEKPREISVQDDDGEILAIEVVDMGDRHQIMTFA